ATLLRQQSQAAAVHARPLRQIAARPQAGMRPPTHPPDGFSRWLASATKLLAHASKTRAGRCSYKQGAPAAPAGATRHAVAMARRFSSLRNGPAAALRGPRRELFAMAWPQSGTTLRKTAGKLFTETRLIRAYMSLFLAPTGEDGTKAVPLAR